MSLNLTYPEVVTPYNIARMRQLIENGPMKHPGARFIIRDDGTRTDLRYAKKPSDLHLDYGYKVERYVRNDPPRRGKGGWGKPCAAEFLICCIVGGRVGGGGASW